VVFFGWNYPTKCSEFLLGMCFGTSTLQVDHMCKLEVYSLHMLNQSSFQWMRTSILQQPYCSKLCTKHVQGSEWNHIHCVQKKRTPTQVFFYISVENV